MRIWVTVVVLGLGLAGCGEGVVTSSETAAQRMNRVAGEQAAMRAANLPRKRMKLKTLHVGGSRSAVVGRFSIRNNNVYTVKDVEIICLTYGESDTAIDELRATAFITIPPNAAKRTPQLRFGSGSDQVLRTSCELGDAAKG